MAKEKTREQKITALNMKIQRNQTCIRNAQIELGRYESTRSALNELYEQLQAEMQIFIERKNGQEEIYLQLEEWRGDVYNTYKELIGFIKAEEESLITILSDRLENLFEEINRLNNECWSVQQEIEGWQKYISLWISERNTL